MVDDRVLVATWLSFISISLIRATAESSGPTGAGSEEERRIAIEEEVAALDAPLLRRSNCPWRRGHSVVSIINIIIIAWYRNVIIQA